MAAPLAERIEWQRPPELPGLEVLLAERAARRWVVFHETYTICTFTNCNVDGVEWRYRRKTYRAEGGGLMLMEPGEVHANTKITPPVSFRVALIKPSLVCQAGEELGMKTARPQWASGYTMHPLVFQEFSALHASLEGTCTVLERESRLVACVRLLLEHCTESGAPASRQAERAALVRTRDYICEHYLDPLTLHELSVVSRLSRFHLVRAFTKEFGIPPHAYQLQVRIGRARTLLAAGHSLALTAAEIGFADQSHFTRHFKKVYGITPGQYFRGGTGRR